MTDYTATTVNATNKVTATAASEDAEVTIHVGETTIESGTSATWTEGENVVTIDVTNGDNTKTYMVTVTYYPEVEFAFIPTGLTANETDGLSAEEVIIDDADTYDIVVTSATADNEHITVTADGATLTVECDDDTVLTNENLPITVTVVGKRGNNPATGEFDITYQE